MNKKILAITCASLISCVLFGCGNELTTSINTSNQYIEDSYVPQNEFEKVFKSLKNNNFSIDSHQYLVNYNRVDRNQKYYYTPYSLQSEGDLGFSGIAQGDDLVFKYSIVDDEIISSAPLINSYTGLRYETIYDYTYGMQDFDLSYLSKEKDSDGYYTYEFGKNSLNDSIMLTLFLRMSPNPAAYPIIKMKSFKNTLNFEIEILRYTETSADTMTLSIYDIGTTENEIIKKYLNDGKSSKNPLDQTFFKTINPYLFTQNYTVEFDASGMYDINQSNFKMTEYCTKNAIYDVPKNIENAGGRFLLNGVVTNFVIDNQKLKVTSTPSDQYQNFYSDLYYYSFAYTFLDINHSLFLGYQDDKFDNVYYLTDSQLVYIFSSFCYCEIYDEMYCDKLKIEIIDEETNEFVVYFELYNRLTKKDLGVYKATFSNVGKTIIPEVDEYLSLGDKPSTQSKDDLIEVMDLFKQGNYSQDILSAVGNAKYIYNPRYFYCEVYGSQQNYGFIKEDGKVYEFAIIDNKVVVDYQTVLNMKLPGCGEYMYIDPNDLHYLSHFDQGLYNYENYKVETLMGQEIWRLNDTELSKKLFNYIFEGPREDAYPRGTGIIVSNPEDSAAKITLLSSYIKSDGTLENYLTFTFYDIGCSSNEIIEEYLNSKGEN